MTSRKKKNLRHSTPYNVLFHLNAQGFITSFDAFRTERAVFWSEKRKKQATETRVLKDPPKKQWPKTCRRCFWNTTIEIFHSKSIDYCIIQSVWSIVQVKVCPSNYSLTYGGHSWDLTGFVVKFFKYSSNLTTLTMT